MPDPTPCTVSIDAFACLAALLDDPLADRPKILHDAGIDEHAWREIRAAWAPRLVGDDSRARSRFVEVYATALRTLASAPAGARVSAEETLQSP
jgi:hypothetical protein